MKMIMFGFVAAVTAGFGLATQASAEPLKIVAAENFYGDVARQIGGAEVEVTSILTNPNQDPHEFEANASTARAVAGARFVIYSGADYDPWVTTLLAAGKSGDRKVLIVADLVDRKSGDNPHLWYDPQTMPALAKALAAAFESSDPAHRADYESRLSAFLTSLQPLQAEVARMRKKYGGVAVTATEPVFGYMADALGLKMKNQSFQISVMNDTEPSASDVAAFESDLKSRRVKVLFYNSQVTDDLTARLLKLAKVSGVAVVGVTETEPPGTSFQDWMHSQLKAADKALGNPGS